MFASSWKVVLLLLVGVLFCSVAFCSTDGTRSVRAFKSRHRTPYTSWRIVLCLTQSQSSLKIDIQKSWAKARLEMSHADINVSYVEAQGKTETQVYPLSLLNRFCTEIKGGKTILGLIIGGGSIGS